MLSYTCVRMKCIFLCFDIAMSGTDLILYVSFIQHVRVQYVCSVMSMCVGGSLFLIHFVTMKLKRIANLECGVHDCCVCMCADGGHHDAASQPPLPITA